MKHCQVVDPPSLTSSGIPNIVLDKKESNASSERAAAEIPVVPENIACLFIDDDKCLRKVGFILWFIDLYPYESLLRSQSLLFSSYSQGQ